MARPAEYGDCPAEARAGCPEEVTAMMAGVPDEPPAVVAAGPAGAGRAAVLAALLDVPASALRVPQGSYLVVGPGEAGEGEAYVPGYRRPYPYRPEPVGAGPALARPPRRVELTLPAALLRHVNCVDAPDTAMLATAGRRVVRDVVERGGALLFVLSAAVPPTPADLALLADVVVGEAAVFFVVTGDRLDARVSAHRRRADPEPADPWPAGWDPADSAPPGYRPADPDRHRAAVLAAVPALAEAPWFVVDPTAPDVMELRRALTDWAALEALRRASLAPPVVPEVVADSVAVAAGAGTSDWEDRLDARVRGGAHRTRRSLALELANVHLRCVQAIVFGSGCQSLPDLLDQELHALSIQAVEDCETGVREVLDDAIGRIFDAAPGADAGIDPGPGVDSEPSVAPGIRRRLAVAVGWGLAGYRRGRDLDRVLLVGSEGTVHPVTGLGAVRALTAYPAECRSTVLPPLGVALAGGCYQHWRNPANADVAEARSWLQRVLREVELELSREVLRRFAAVQAALVPVLRTAVAEGRLRLTSTPGRPSGNDSGSGHSGSGHSGSGTADPAG